MIQFINAFPTLNENNEIKIEKQIAHNVIMTTTLAYDFAKKIVDQIEQRQKENTIPTSGQEE